MPDVISCPACGARNPADAPWCGQCYGSLEESRESETLELDGGSTEAVSVVAETRQASVEREPVWTCAICETVNPIESSACAACSSPIYESFGAGSDPPPDVDPRAVLLRGLLVPGLGHTAVRQGVMGAAIGILALLSAAFGTLLMVSGMFPYGLFLVLLAVGVWLLAALDAYRLATGATGEVVLRPKILTILVGVVVSVVVLAVMSVQGRGGEG